MTLHLVMVGPPGAGKGTQAKQLAKAYQLAHLSTGDMFRDQVARHTELGKLVDPIMKSGGLVPDDLTVAIVRDRLQQPDCTSGVVFDGFPRTVAQAQALDALLHEMGASIALVPCITVNDEAVVERISGRYTDRNTGQIYHLKFNPPPAGADLFQRPDDQEAAVRQRLQEYYRKTEPLIAYYQQRGVLQQFDGMQSIDDVFSAIDQAIRQL
ncbi:MAG TPA: adenylate kinase [Anaerolineales bacterium]|nr:adenylate kinase [Anaerolineales bacterium]